MRKVVCLIGVFWCSHYHLLAQDAEILRVKSEEDIAEVIPADVKYRYSEFRTGNISFYNGRSSAAKLNYNILLGEMQFLDRKGDTLSLADEHTIKIIMIGEDVFYYDGRFGYLEVVKDYHPIKLALNQTLQTVTSEKGSAYGQSSGVSSIKTINFYSTDNSQVQILKQKGDILLTKKASYFLVDQNNRCHKLNKSSILKVFADHKRAIKDYLKEASINFNKEEDLKKLLQFCDALRS